MIPNHLVKLGSHIRYHGFLPIMPNFFSVILPALWDLRIHPCEAATMTTLPRREAKGQWAEEIGQRMTKF